MAKRSNSEFANTSPDRGQRAPGFDGSTRSLKNDRTPIMGANKSPTIAKGNTYKGGRPGIKSAWCGPWTGSGKGY
jgi:hypothetical protein